MNITLYRNSSESHVMYKQLETVSAVSGTLKDGAHELKPDILIEYSGFPNINYMYIEEYGRYYYVEVENVSEYTWILHGKVDVLMSHAEGINNSVGLITHNNTTIDYYLQDRNKELYANPHIVYKNFSGTFSANDDSLILVTI